MMMILPILLWLHSNAAPVAGFATLSAPRSTGTDTRRRHKSSNAHATTTCSLYVSSTTAVSDAEVVAANSRQEKEANEFQAALDKAGLSLLHGLLHASGCRRLSDLRMLTFEQMSEMGVDAFDRPVLQGVIANQIKLIHHQHHHQDNAVNSGDVSGDSNHAVVPVVHLSTCVDGSAFFGNGANKHRLLSRFQVAKPLDFNLQVICAKNGIFKGRLFTGNQCEQLNRMAEYHAYKGIGNKLTNVASGWTNEIYTLTAQHMACESIPGFISTTNDIFRQLVRQLYSLYPGRIRNGSIQFESRGEPHLVKYNGKARGTALHTDNDDAYASTSITINANLSSKLDFGGGGTYISCLDETIQLEQGEMLIHLGNLEHAGADIAFGVRRLLVAFLACEWEGRKVENNKDTAGMSTTTSTTGNLA
jgi:hypothetical protein